MKGFFPLWYFHEQSDGRSLSDFISYASTYNLNRSLCQACFYEHINCDSFLMTIAFSSCYVVNTGVIHFEVSAIWEQKGWVLGEMTE